MRFVLDNSVTMRWLFGDGSAEDLAYASSILALIEAPKLQKQSCLPSGVSKSPA
jgi:hypothetical protein